MKMKCFNVGRPKFRRSRTIFNPEQLEVLEKHFEKIKYPGVKQRKRIADEIGLPEERVQIWFQNRRAKDKRQMEQQAKLQKLVDEAICGSQEENRIKGGAESGEFYIQKFLFKSQMLDIWTSLMFHFLHKKSNNCKNIYWVKSAAVAQR